MAEVPIGRAEVYYYETGLPVPTVMLHFTQEIRKTGWCLAAGYDIEKEELIPFSLPPNMSAGKVLWGHNYSSASVVTSVKYSSDATKPLRLEVYSVLQPVLVTEVPEEPIGKLVSYPIALQTLPLTPGSEVLNTIVFTNPVWRFFPVFVNQDPSATVEFYAFVFVSKDPMQNLPVAETYVKDVDLTTSQEIILYTEGRKTLEVYASSTAATNFYLDVAKTEPLTYEQPTYPAEWVNYNTWTGVTEVRDGFFNAWRIVRLRSDPAGSSGDTVTLVLTAK